MPRPGVPLGQGHDQAQVGLDQVVLRPSAVLGDPLEVDALAGTQHPAAFGELVVGEQPASIRLASSTSWLALSSDTLPICLR